jgi:heparanase
MHNTFASSDYGMLDESTLAPRPNYWAALLWRKLMGTTVFAAGDAPAAGLNLYAHSLRDHPSGMALLVINPDRAASQELEIPVRSDRYTLTAQELTSSSVQLNGRNLELGAEDALPSLQGEPTPPGKLLFAPASITFLALADAKNSSSR